jgi:hypothetical protein
MTATGTSRESRPVAAPSSPSADVPCCRFCRAADGEIVVDLGSQPSSELFPSASDPGPDPTFSLRMWLCSACGLAQLADDAEVPEEPEGQEPAALRVQRADAVARLVDARILPISGTVAEFPSPHGGTWLDLLGQCGLVPAGPGEHADIVIDGCFGMMHGRDQREVLQARADRLADGGTLLLQFHSLAAIVEGLQWSALRLGHYAYYSTPAMIGMLADVGLTATAAFSFPLYGGTVLLAASRDGRPNEALLDAVTGPERAVGVERPDSLAPLQGSVQRTATGLRDLLCNERDAGRLVYGYGAASRAVSLLCLAGVDAGLLAGVADVSAEKQGKRMPGTDIPVITPAELVAAAPDLVLVFVSELVEEVRLALPQIEAAGGRWLDVGSGV